MLTYAAALEYIYKFTDYEKQTGYLYAPENFDLARMEHLLVLLDSPHRKLRTVHIAGSKGKGSTASMIASILKSAGYRVGLYTSPHLHSFRERIRVDGELIARSEVSELVAEIQPLADQVTGITTFEIITALALLYFSREQVDIAVLEVGLGGRLDATNVVIPDVAVITSLSYDHTHLLGDTLAEIAREKAGIIKPHVPVVSAPQKEEALAVLQEMCQQKHATLTLVGRDWVWTRQAFDTDGQSFAVCRQSPGEPAGSAPTCRQLWIPLLGEHQIVNATTAVAVIARLRQRGWIVFDQDIETGLRQVSWPGRLEIISRNPLLIADSAHNSDSAHKLIVALEELFPNRALILIFGASNDKDIRGMFREFLPHVKRTILTHSDHPRAAAPTDLRMQTGDNTGQVELAESIDQAIDRALELAEPSDVICATGSVFIAAATRAAWAKRTSFELST